MILVLTCLPHHHHGEMVLPYVENECKIALHDSSQRSNGSDSHDDDCCTHQELFNILKYTAYQCGDLKVASLDLHFDNLSLAVLFSFKNLLGGDLNVARAYVTPPNESLSVRFYTRAYSHRGPPLFIA